MNYKQQLTTVTVNNLQIKQGRKNTLPGGSGLMAITAVGNAALGNQLASNAAHQAMVDGMEDGYYFSFDDQGIHYQGFFFSVPLTEGEQIEVVSHAIPSVGAMSASHKTVHTVLAIRKAEQHSLWVAPYNEVGWKEGDGIKTLKGGFLIATLLAPIWIVLLPLLLLMLYLVQALVEDQSWTEYWAEFPYIMIPMILLFHIPIIGSTLSLILFLMAYPGGEKVNQVFRLLGFKEPTEVSLADLRTDYIKAWEARHQQPFPEQTDPHQFFYLPEHLETEADKKAKADAQAELQQRVAQERAEMEQRLKNNKKNWR